MSRPAAKLAFSLCILLSSLAWAAPSCTIASFGALSGNSGAVNTTGASGIYLLTVGFTYPMMPTDDQGNYYFGIGLAGPSSAGPQAMLWWAQASSAGGAPTLSATHHFSFEYSTGTATFPAMLIFVCTGTLSTPVPVPLTNGVGQNNGPGSSTIATGSATPSTTGDLIISGGGSNTTNSFTITSTPATFTAGTTQQACCEGVFGGWAVSTSTAAVNPSWTLSAGTDWVGLTVVIKQASDAVLPVYGPTINLQVGGPVPYPTGGQAVSCSPKTTTTLLWPAYGAFDSNGNLVWEDINGNYVGVWNRQTTTQFLYGVSVGAGCTAIVAGGNASVGFNYSTTPIAGTTAQLAHPAGLTLDSSNNVYVTDQQNHRAFELTTAGKLFTVAGSGNHTNGICTNGQFFGYGGLAVNAGLNCPQGIWWTSIGGNPWLFLSDSNNRLLSAVNMGSAPASVFGQTNVCAGCIVAIAGIQGSTSCPAVGSAGTSTQTYPLGLWVDSNQIYWADFQCNQVRFLDSGGIVRLFAGNGSLGCVDGAATTTAQLSHPYGISFDSNHVGYVANTSCSTFGMVKNGVYSTIAGNPGYSTNGGFGPWGGPARFAAFTPNINQVQGPVSATPDNQGSLWLFNTGGNNILSMNLPCFASCVQ